MLGPLLFIIYINDFDEGLSCRLCKFADDTKLGNNVDHREEVDQIQNDLIIISEWARKWQMEFNQNKSKVLHAGARNPGNKYTLGLYTLSSTDRERDLGILVSSDLTPRLQCIESKNKANIILGFINRTVTNKCQEVILRLYLALVRPHLDYSVQFWCPYFKLDMNRIESVQRRMTKMIPGLRELPYNERLGRLNLHSLQRRRLRGDLIEVCKWIKGISKVDFNDIFKVDKSVRIRGNGLNLAKNRYRLKRSNYWFGSRVVN